MTPRVSVVMTAYNAQRYLSEALDSVLDQTLSDLEFIIVDDASTDATPDLLESYAQRDKRIRVLRNEENRGPYPSANRGLVEAAAPIVARMDADDVSEPDRLRQQVDFLDAHPDHIVVGSGYRSIDERGESKFVRLNPMGDSSMRWIARFRTPVMPASCCFRAIHFDGRPVRYGESSPTSQDYGLVTQLLRDGKGGALAPPLIRYRMHEANISMNRRKDQERTSVEISLRFIEDECGAAKVEDFRPLIETLYRERLPEPSDLADSIRAFDSLIERDASGDRAKERWMRRRAAGILAEAYLPGGSLSRRLRRSMRFARTGRRYVGPLGLRAMEIKGMIQTLPGP